MRAVVLKQFGAPGVLTIEDVPDAVAGPGQALIEVAFANITFIETQFRATGSGPFVGELPMVPGNGVGGLVTAVGTDSDDGLIGKQVISATGGSGGYAELAVGAVDGLVEVPDGVELDDAVALLADGRTATMLLAAANVGPGERVLVEAAGGGVGTLLVQLAAAQGAKVIGAAGSATKLELARDLGAEMAVDYSLAGWTTRVREAGGPVDVVFDGVGGEVGRGAFDLLDRGGRMVSFGLASGTWAGVAEATAADRGVTLLGLTRLTPQENRALIESALKEAAGGRLRPVIGQRFPLARAADAHAAIEARSTVGKTLLEVPGL